ncbi:MAG: hypothetical protein HY275_10755 [Gemmatimonadetes bacterium]|nr:hypothetical protein [Gemmatimonadota bacterium]
MASVLALGTAGARWATTAADTRALASADTTRLYLAPVLMAGVHDTLLEERVARAIGRWTGVRVVGASMLRRTGGVVSRPSDDELRQAALDLRARRYVRAFVAGTPSRPELSIVLTDASQAQQPLADIRTSWPADVGVQDSLLSDVVERALLRRALPMAWQGSALGSRSLPARQALAQALAAFDQWELLAADSAFEMALRYDPELAEASLWQAAARYWRGLEPSRWAAPARAAAAGSARLSPPDRLRAAALTHTLEGDPVVACAAWNQSIAADSTSFLGWFGAANCLARDRAVLPDPRSPSGWRFRTSYRAALTRYRRAFEQHPATLRSLRGDGYLELRRLLKLNAGMLREGVAASGPPAVFYALATLSADTLAFIPFPAAVFQAGRSPVLTRTLASVSAAVRRQQELFRDIAITFISSDPQGSEPREALAWAQLMLGDASALDTLRSARRLATSAPMQLRLQGEWAWMRAILSYPDDVEGLRLAADVADSVLGSPARGDVDPVLVASLAGLTGRAELAASVEAGHASTRNTGLPLPLAGPSRRLLALAASGAPGSALDPVARHLDSLLDHATAQAERRSLRGLAFGRAAALASLDVTLPHADEVIDAGPQVGEARAAWRRGDASAASRALAGIAAERRLFSAADLSLDVVLPEAELLARLGRPDEAVRWLDPVLLAVRARAAAPEPITSLVLVRAAAFRARLARETGDSATLGRRVEALRALVGRGDAMVKALVPDARGATPLQRDH